MAVKIFDLCIQNDISLEIEWVPRSQNVAAYFYSKLFDFDDWAVQDVYFNYFNKLWGPFSCDIFADENNHKTQRFFSAFWCPSTSGADAFAHDWSPFNCWTVPPINFIVKVILHMKLCRAKDTLVIPKWPSSNFWPLLVAPTGLTILSESTSNM